MLIFWKRSTRNWIQRKVKHMTKHWQLMVNSSRVVVASVESGDTRALTVTRESSRLKGLLSNVISVVILDTRSGHAPNGRSSKSLKGTREIKHMELLTLTTEFHCNWLDYEAGRVLEWRLHVNKNNKWRPKEMWELNMKTNDEETRAICTLSDRKGVRGWYPPVTDGWDWSIRLNDRWQRLSRNLMETKDVHVWIKEEVDVTTQIVS